ncbi:MAG: hypothetical protein JEY71_11730 [Sphaerochaeta sp.]|nr:hypothetical protein [Sphaerochaeta sp.]
MKKTFITILLVLLFVAVPMFAVTDSFNVSTTVAGIGMIKVTTVASTIPNVGAFNALEAYGDLVIISSGAQIFTAYLSTLSNSRSGYTVTMDATPMKSTVLAGNSYIDYTVTVNSVALTTTGSTAVTGVEILNVASLTGIDTESHAVALSVDATTFDAAVAGSYTGTVTFTYAAT